MKRWQSRYGDAMARDIAAANAREPALDLTVKSEPQQWAARLDGRVLPTGTVRLLAHGPVPKLPGFDGGGWWVQDAAAALPARLLGDVHGKTVADLCAAPGGKTAQLAAAGAHVTAVDRSLPRLAPVARQSGAARPAGERRSRRRHAMGERAVRRHPARRTMPRHRHHPPAPRHSVAQERNRSREAFSAFSRGCSTAPRHCSSRAGPWSIAPARWSPRKASRPSRHCWRATPACGGDRLWPRRSADWPNVLTPEGDLRTLPCHLPDPDPRMAGLDGFYAARIVRN